MKIIIVGCGKVGYTLAEELSEEGHDITLIDTNSRKLEHALSTLDIQGIEGNGTSYRTQLEAGIKSSDLLIAVTGKDEINFLCCLIAKKAGNCNTIARVRDPEYYSEINYIRDELGLSLAINPELECAMGIAQLIEVPSALDITSFAKGRTNLIKLSIAEDSILHGMSVYEFATKIHSNTLICAIERGHEVIIPYGDTLLKGGDNLYVIVPPSEIHNLLNKIGIKTKPIKSVMIIGGSTIAYYLARHLESSHVKVKILERSMETCERLSDLLPHAMIINGDAVDRRLLLEEGIQDTDAFVSLTNMDEENLVVSMFANRVSDAKIITKVDKITFEEVIDDLPIGSVACPKNVTAKSIIQYVRAMQNQEGNAVSVHRLAGGKIEALEFKVDKDTKHCGEPLRTVKTKQNILIASIFTRGKVELPTGNSKFAEGDSLIVVTNADTKIYSLNDIFED